MRRNPYMGATRHTMLGPGGQIVEPKSESTQLQRAINALTGLDLRGDPQSRRWVEYTIEVLHGLKDQVQAGYHRNPRGGRFNAGEVIGQIAEDVHDIRYTHAKNGDDFEHMFNGDVEVFAVLRNGKRELLISHRRGLALWDEFPD